MRVLVTGGAGFIGSNVARRLLDQGHAVLICDNMSTGLASNIDPRASFLELGAESPALLQHCTQFAVDTIAHIGGNSSGEIGELDPINDLQWNVTSTLNLLCIAEKLGIKKFVYASSMGVYGQGGGNQALSEQDSLEPISVYGTGKICSEQYMKTFASRGINAISMRMFNVYGPGQNLTNPRQGMVSIFIDQRLRGPIVTVRGSLNRIRDFVYIDDVVRAWEFALSLDAHSGFKAVNIATSRGTSVREIIQLIGASAGSIEIDEKGATPADQDKVIGDNRLAKRFLRWQPEVELDEGIRKMWTWAKCLKNSL